MNKYEAPALIAAKFPMLDSELLFLTITGNINKAMSIFAGYTRNLITTRNYLKVHQCMALANMIYEQGDAIVKNAVSNIYIYSFSLMSLCCNKVEWHIIQSKIPFSLYALYIRQVMQSSC